MAQVVRILALATIALVGCSAQASHPPTSGLDGQGFSPGDAAVKHPVPHDASDAVPADVGREASPTDAALEAPVPCPSDTPVSCLSPAPTYPDVGPILDAYCKRCHQPGQTLPELTSYSTTFAARDQVFTTLTGCTMPMPWPTAKERELLLAWLICGAPP